jgi:hypothetical protein
MRRFITAVCLPRSRTLRAMLAMVRQAYMLRSTIRHTRRASTRTSARSLGSAGSAQVLNTP